MSPGDASGKRKRTDNQSKRRRVKNHKDNSAETEESSSSEGTGAQSLSDFEDSVVNEDDESVAGPSSRPQVVQQSWKSNLHNLGVRQALEQAQRRVGVIQDVGGTTYRYTDNSDPTVGAHPDPAVRKRRIDRWGETLAAFISSGSCLDEKGWRGVRPLGHGGFGMVGLWSRTIKEKDGDEEQEEEEEEDDDDDDDDEEEEDLEDYEEGGEEEEDDDEGKKGDGEEEEEEDGERAGTGKKSKDKGKGTSAGLYKNESESRKKGKEKEKERKPKEYMAIKQTFRQRPGLFEEGKIDTEARMLSLFNHLRCDRSNIIRLKHHINFPLQEIHRLYLEYCPHGDLFTLAMRYKRWRRYFPEPFLWHLFHQLSKAVLLMQKGNLPKDEEDPPAPRYQDIVIDRLKALCSERNLVFKSKILKRQLVELLENDDRTRAHRKEEEKAKNLIDETPVRAHWKEIVHRDIRPLNIFLGEPDPDSRWRDYPLPKLADFGLAIQTNSWEACNPDAYQRHVDDLFDAPEMRRTMGRYKGDNQGKGSAKDKKDKRGEKTMRRKKREKDKKDEEGGDDVTDDLEAEGARLSGLTNVYQLGAVMFFAASLRCIDPGAPAKETVRYEHIRYTDSGPPYSVELWDLIESCVQTRPVDRPTPDQLYHMTRASAEASQESVEQSGKPEDFRVWFRGNEINDMETSFFKPHVVERVLVEDTPKDPTLPPLRPPSVRSFHPYSSFNFEFFPGGDHDFRNDRSQSEERRYGEIKDDLKFIAGTVEDDLQRAMRKALAEGATLGPGEGEGSPSRGRKLWDDEDEDDGEVSVSHGRGCVQ